MTLARLASASLLAVALPASAGTAIADAAAPSADGGRPTQGISSGLAAGDETGSGWPRAWATEDPWRFRAVVYGWLPSISGDSRFPASTGGSGVSIAFGDYLSALEFVFMGGLEARRGRLGFLADVIYLDFDAEKSATRELTVSVPGGPVVPPVGASARVDIGLSGWATNFAATWLLVDRPGYELQVLGGLRYLDISSSVAWTFSGNVAGMPAATLAGRKEIDPSIIDGIAGVRGRVALGDSRWFLPWHLDLGAGESDLTWQAYAGAGYAFEWGEVVAGWRHLDYRFEDGGVLQDIELGGPLVGAAFRW